MTMDKVEVADGADTAVRSVSVGTAVAFLRDAIAESNPIGAGVFAGASVIYPGLVAFSKKNR